MKRDVNVKICAENYSENQKRLMSWHDLPRKMVFGIAIMAEREMTVIRKNCRQSTIIVHCYM